MKNCKSYCVLAIHNKEIFDHIFILYQLKHLTNMKHITVLSLLFIISGNLSMVTEYKGDPLMSKWVTQELLLINQNSFSMAFCCKWSKGKRLIDSFFTFFSIVVIVTHKVFFLVCSFCMTYLHNTSHVSCASRNIFCELIWVTQLKFSTWKLTRVEISRLMNHYDIFH